MVYQFFFLFMAGVVFVCPQSATARLSDYAPSTEVQQGQSVCEGSDTLGIVMENWRSAFRDSGLIISRGSATAHVALTRGRSSLAPMIRAMTEAEVRNFESAGTGQQQ